MIQYKSLYISTENSIPKVYIRVKISIQIRITVSKEINDLLERVSNKLGKKKSMLARELMEQKLYDLDLIQKELQNMDSEK